MPRRMVSERAPKRARRPSPKRAAPEEVVSAAQQAPSMEQYLPAEQTPRTWVTVRLRPDVGDEIAFQSSAAMQRIAMEWTYVVRNRHRWAHHEPTRRSQEDRVRADLATLGIPEDSIRRLASAGVVEVSIPYSREGDGWEARILPWEYLLTAATRRDRHLAGGKRSLTVVRHLDSGPESPLPLGAAAPPRVLYVESAPGPVGGYFTYETELEIVRGSFPESVQQSQFNILNNPDRAALEKTLAECSPTLLHLAGVDTHQAAALGWIEPYRGSEQDPCHGDGYILGEGLGRLSCPDLAHLFDGIPSQSRPQLTACNFYHSGPRLAAMCAAGGSGAAIGFQDEFDDRLTELFFSNFYPAWRLSEWDLLSAFRHACDRLRAVPDGLVGTGVVLWSRTSLVEPLREALRQTAQQRAEPQTTEREPSIKEKVEEAAKERVYTGRDLTVTIENFREINYSMLHNDGRWFRQLLLSRPVEVGYVPDVYVRVELTTGMGVSHTYEWRGNLFDRQLDLSDDVQFPLLYGSGYGAREAVHTVLKVRVEQGTDEDRIVVHDSVRRVSLLPLEEWKDDDEGRAFLPSFVLPRDPGVVEVIDSAQRYLMALLDDGQAGFDGYQSLGTEGDGTDDVVDLQVQAIWSALAYDRMLYYINPPPTYTPGSQRVRTPSEVLLTKRGTCIDLALMVAACLEFIEIYPVIVLLKGHAFPAYWRSHAAWKAFWQGRPERGALAEAAVDPTAATTLGTTAMMNVAQAAVTPPGGSPPAAGPRRPSWYQSLEGGTGDSRATIYEDVMQLVRRRELVPLETVWLTQRGSFYGAIEEGAKNLRFKADFEALVDITLARQDGVTPIPFHFRENFGR